MYSWLEATPLLSPYAVTPPFNSAMIFFGSLEGKKCPYLGVFAPIHSDFEDVSSPQGDRFVNRRRGAIWKPRGELFPCFKLVEIRDVPEDPLISLIWNGDNFTRILKSGMGHVFLDFDDNLQVKSGDHFEILGDKLVWLMKWSSVRHLDGLCHHGNVFAAHQLDCSKNGVCLELFRIFGRLMLYKLVWVMNWSSVRHLDGYVNMETCLQHISWAV